jgi:hypothetical protein
MSPERYIVVNAGYAEVNAVEKRRRMLRLKMSGLQKAGWKITGSRMTGFRAVAGIVTAGLLMTGAAYGQTTSTSAVPPATPQATSAFSKIGPIAPVTYDNKYEVYGGLNFMNFQAGQSLPKRMNLGGGEASVTYWLTKRLGIAADYRGDAGTTPVFPQANSFPYFIVRPLVYMNTGMLGAQWRGPKNQFVAINYHGFFGASHGTFNATQKQSQPTDSFYSQTGLYTNRTKPIAALGGSLDFNRSKNWAIRLSPDLILEHFGTETREFFSISAGVVYRFGKQ